MYLALSVARTMSGMGGDSGGFCGTRQSALMNDSMIDRVVSARSLPSHVTPFIHRGLSHFVVTGSAGAKPGAAWRGGLLGGALGSHGLSCG